MSMEMASSTIIALRFFLRRWDLRPGVNGSVESSLGMVIRILLRQTDLGSFLMVAARSIILAIICFAATSLTMVIHTLDSPATSVRLFCPDILVLVLLPMLIDYFNSCVRASSLGIVAQIKIMGEPSLVFTGLRFGFITRLCHRRRKSLKTLKICSFFLDFILYLLKTAYVSIPCTIYSYKYILYWLSKKIGG
jgi:hypothetical protein